jgi:hypothetical protein
MGTLFLSLYRVKVSIVAKPAIRAVNLHHLPIAISF